MVLVQPTWALSWSMRRFRDCSMERSISDFLSCRVWNRRSKCSVAQRSANWPFSYREKMSLCSVNAQVWPLKGFYIGAASKQEPATRSNADTQERRDQSLHTVVWREEHLSHTQTDCFTASLAGFVQLIKIYLFFWSEDPCRN